MVEWLAFNAFVRRSVGRRGRLALVPRDGLERGGDWPPARGQVRGPRARRRLATRSRAGPLSSSEAEMRLRGRGGCEWATCWASLNPFLSSGFGRRLGAFVGPVALTCVCVFESGLSNTIRVSLIVAPDSSPRGFGRVDGFGQRVIRRSLS